MRSPPCPFLHCAVRALAPAGATAGARRQRRCATAPISASSRQAGMRGHNALLAETRTAPGGRGRRGDTGCGRRSGEILVPPLRSLLSTRGFILRRSPRGSAGDHLRRYRTRHERDKRPTQLPVQQSSVPSACFLPFQDAILLVWKHGGAVVVPPRRAARDRGPPPDWPLGTSPAPILFPKHGRNIGKGAS